MSYGFMQTKAEAGLLTIDIRIYAP